MLELNNLSMVILTASVLIFMAAWAFLLKTACSHLQEQFSLPQKAVAYIFDFGYVGVTIALGCSIFAAIYKTAIV